MKSFKYAFEGLYKALKKERNFRIMLGLFLLSLFFIFYFDLSSKEAIVVVLSGVLMLAVELINSAFEKTLDVVKKHHDENVKYIKDLMAGASLLVSFVWFFVIIYIVFLP